MSIAKVRQGLELALFNMSPALPIAYENQEYTPVIGTPYQRVVLIPGSPINSTMGDAHHTLQGILFVELFYPKGATATIAAARAELMKSVFFRGASFVNGGLTTIVSKTPIVGRGAIQDGWWVLPVSIMWYAEVFA